MSDPLPVPVNAFGVEHQEAFKRANEKLKPLPVPVNAFGVEHWRMDKLLSRITCFPSP